MKKVVSAPQVLKLRIKKELSVTDIESKSLEPLLSNVVKIIVKEINHAKDPEIDEKTEINYDDDEVPGKILQKIDARCSNLFKLHVKESVIPSSVSMDANASRLVETLTCLHLESVTLKNIYKFLPATYPKLQKLYLEICTLEGMTVEDDSQLPTIQMKNLKQLRLYTIENFGDKEFRQLTQSNLGKLTELQLVSLKMKGEDFDKLDLANLTELEVASCEFDAQWLSSTLNHLPLLETLELRNIDFKDTCSPYSFRDLTELRVLEMEFCDFGKRTVSAMARYLPKLKRWKLTPNEDGLITDEAFSGLVQHPDLEEVLFDRVQLTDAAVRQLVLTSPNIKELSLNVCSIGDEVIELLRQRLGHSLTKLSLEGTRITDVGLAALEPMFDKIDEIYIQSRLVTVAGVQRSFELLTASKIPHVLALLFDDPERQLRYCRGVEDDDDPDQYTGLTLKRLPSNLALAALKRFRGIKHMNLDNVDITVAEVEQIGESSPIVQDIGFCSCDMTEEAAACVGRHMLNLDYLYTNDTRLNEAVILKLLQSVTVTDKLERVVIGNTPLPSSDSLRTILELPFVAHCTIFNVHTSGFENNINVANLPNYKVVTIHVDDGGNVDDRVVLDLVRLVPELTELTLSGIDAITADKLAEIAGLVPLVTSLTMKSKILDDDVMTVIGRDFAAKLKSIDLQFEQVTDQGLENLGKQLEVVETLTIKGTAITDEGVRRIAPRLAAIKTLNVYDNPKVTMALRDYMVATYPNVEHEAFPEPEAVLAIAVPEAEAEAEADAEQQQEVNAGLGPDAGVVVVDPVIQVEVQPVEEGDVDSLHGVAAAAVGEDELPLI